ncbi:MAG TPA: dienelactone hydrolase family protein [Herpetosiphonaceae bacterium]
MTCTTHQIEDMTYLEYRTGPRETPDALPCVLVLHWMGAQPQDMLPLCTDFPLPARFLIPSGSYPCQPGYSWYPLDFYQRPLEQQAPIIRATAARVAAFLHAATQQVPCRGKPFAMGMSQGGDLSYALAAYHSDLIAGALPLGARWSPEFPRLIGELTAAPHPPIWAFHGAADPIVPLAEVEAGVAWLRQRGIVAQLQSYPEVGHGISRQMIADMHRVLQRAMA